MTEQQRTEKFAVQTQLRFTGTQSAVCLLRQWLRSQTAFGAGSTDGRNRPQKP